MCKMSRAIFLVALGILATVGSLQAESYYYYDLGTLGGTYSTARGINDLGQVVGDSKASSGTQYAFIWDSVNGMRNIGAPGEYPNSTAYDINNSGLIVGAWAPGYYVYPFLKYPGQPMELFGFRGSAYAVNNTGQIVGGMENFAYLKNPGEELQNIGNLGGYGGSASADINNSGQIVGTSDTGTGSSHAFLKNPGQPMQDLGTLGGSGGSEAFGINKTGQVVGTSSTNVVGQSHAFIKDPGQPMQDLGSLGGTYSKATRINDSGQVVGFSFTSTNEIHAFLYNPGSVMQDLNNLTVNLKTGTTLYVANDINNKGQIVGMAQDASGYHAFLLSPNQNFLNLPYPTGTPPLLAFPLTNNLFPEVYSFIKNNWPSFDVAFQQNINGLGDRWQQFLLKDLQSEGWKDFFRGVQQTSNIVGLGISLGSIGDSFAKGQIALANNNTGLAKTYFEMALLNLSILVGKETIATELRADWQTRALIGGVGTGIAIGIGGLAGTLTPVSVALAANGLVWGDFVAGAASDLANDPPDSNFREVFQSPLAYRGSFNLFGVSPELNRILGLEYGSLWDTYYFLEGITTSINRYSSALEAGDAASAALQLGAFLHYLTLYDSSAIQTADLIKQLKQALINEGLADVSYSKQNILGLQNYLSANGLPQELIDYYRSLGMTDSDIAALIQAMLEFVPPDSLSGTLYSSLSDGSSLLLSASSAPQVPLPSALLLFGTGLLRLVAWRKFRK
uniref:Extracellular repeat protein, HAF family n=1 Tax=Desulfobacca acetoxidans TaxID=60893 RepID=A0A7V4LDK9_9BACT